MASQLAAGRVAVNRFLPCIVVVLIAAPARADVDLVAAGGREVAIDGHRVIELRTPIRGANQGSAGQSGREQVSLAEIEGSRTRVMWSGTVGPQDSDGEVRNHIVLTGASIQKFQTATRVHRCDGVEGRLFAETWNFGKRRFVPAPPDFRHAALAPARMIRALPAPPDTPTGKSIAGFFWTAAPPDANAGFITGRPGVMGYKIVGFRILPGEVRPVRIGVFLGPGEDQHFDIVIPGDPRPPMPLWAPLPAPAATSCVTLVIEEATRGQHGSPPVLAGIEPVSDLDTAGGVQRLVADLAARGACEALVPQVVNLGAQALHAAVRAIPAARGAGRECLADAVDRLLARDPTVSGTAATAGINEAFMAALRGTSHGEERILRSILPRLAPPPTTGLGALFSDGTATEDDRVRAAQLLSLLGSDDATSRLMDAVGSPPAKLRATTRNLLSAFPNTGPASVAALKALAATSPSQASRHADLLYVLGALATRDKTLGADSQDVLLAGTGKSLDFEIRARAIEALGKIATPETVAHLGQLASHDETDPVVRYLSVRELAGIPDDAATLPLLRALDDADPRVRETAALGLGHRATGAAASLIVAAAKREPWPFVRRADLVALGRLCGTGAGDLMVHAIERDQDDVRRAAMQGLVECHDGRAASHLLHAFSRRPNAPGIRDAAARLLGRLQDRRTASEMAAVLKRIVARESQEDPALEGVAITAIQSLAHIGGGEARRAIEEIASDQRPALRRTASDALARIK